MQNLIFLKEKSVFKVMIFNIKIFISTDLSKSVLIIIKEVLIKTAHPVFSSNFLNFLAFRFISTALKPKNLERNQDLKRVNLL
jgi:hypothetical protein